MWTTDLIARVMSLSTEGKAGRDSPAIFGVFRGVHRGQDVTVAHHILPHLVLTVLLSGDITAVHEIRDEIKTVLQDQVNPVSGQDKRNLSAQVIFDLMDHLSHWQRQQRVGKPDRNDHIRVVDEVLSSIDTELMANAALKSRAYARSLRSFEQRILQLRSERRTNFDLHAYFERLHLIYAELDEPDGMGGVSTFVLSPSLEHQIREHEMTGRWTSAQSCWEVRIQQSSEDVSLHIGLLKCLRNLGHYGRWPLKMSELTIQTLCGPIFRGCSAASFRGHISWRLSKLKRPGSLETGKLSNRLGRELLHSVEAFWRFISTQTLPLY